MTFEEYLISKKIDKYAFRASEPLLYADWQDLFKQMHPESFTAHKKFLINPIRRRFLMK
jgi:hypothetical protein